MAAAPLASGAERRWAGPPGRTENGEKAKMYTEACHLRSGGFSVEGQAYLGGAGVLARHVAHRAETNMRSRTALRCKRSLCCLDDACKITNL